MSGSTLPTTTCPAPMTRAALIALRDAGGLSKDCDYVITDHVQGRLVAGTTIHLQAVDASTLSENVSVKTTYDNIAWSGIYDIDAGLVSYLHDNRNNTVLGVTPVRDFDWGNPAISYCSILGGLVTYTYGNTASIQYLYVDGGVLDLTGYAGVIRKLRITGEAVASLAGSRLKFSHCDFSGNSTVNFSNTTSTNTVVGLAVSGRSTVNFSLSTLSISIDGMSVRYSTLLASNVSTGSFTASGLMLDNGFITLSSGVGNVVAIRTSIRDNASLTASIGSVTLVGSEITANASVNATTNSTSLSIQGSSIGTRTTINSNGTGSVSINRSVIDANSLIQTTTGSTSSLTLNNSTIRGSTTINITAASLGANLTLDACLMDTAASITMSNNRSCNISSTTILGSGISLTGSNAITDIIQLCYFALGAAISLACSGAANTLQRCTVIGSASNIQILGTSGAALYNRVNALSGGSVVQNNLGNALTLTQCFVSAGSTINLQNCAAGQNMQYIYVERQGSLTVNKTTNNVIQAVRVDNASFTINATTGNIINATVNGGSLVINDGVISGMTKMMAGTLTINTGTQSNIWYQSPVNKTITASNTNRAEYLGLVSAVPLV